MFVDFLLVSIYYFFNLIYQTFSKLFFVVSVRIIALIIFGQYTSVTVKGIFLRSEHPLSEIPFSPNDKVMSRRGDMNHGDTNMLSSLTCFDVKCLKKTVLDPKIFSMGGQ